MSKIIFAMYNPKNDCDCVNLNAEMLNSIDFSTKHKTSYIFRFFMEYDAVLLICIYYY